MKRGGRENPIASFLPLGKSARATDMEKTLVKPPQMCYTLYMIEQIVAFDIGDRRIGVAFSDPFGSYAMPGDTYFRTGDFAADVDAVAAIARSYGAAAVVCGLPLNADGSESIQTRKTRHFIAALAERVGVPVVPEDERYTTLQARNDLVSLGISSKKDKKNKHVDSLAAVYILEGYLARKGGRS